MIFGAFFCIVLKMGVWCWWPVIFIGGIKEFIDKWQDGDFDWIDLLATVLGAVVIAIMAIFA